MCSEIKAKSIDCSNAMPLENVKYVFCRETNEVFDGGGNFIGYGIANFDDKGDVRSIELTIETSKR